MGDGRGAQVGLAGRRGRALGPLQPGRGGRSPSPWRRGGRRGRSRLSSCRCPGQTCAHRVGLRGGSPGRPWPPTTPRPPGGGGAPGAHSHLLGIVDVGAALAAVAPAKAVVVHAVLLFPPPPPLPRLPHDGQAALHGPAGGRERTVSPSRQGGQGAPQPRGTYLARERLQLPAGSKRPVGGGHGSHQAHSPPGALPCPCSPARPPWPGQGGSQGEPAEATLVSGQWSCLKAGGHRNRGWQGLPATSLCSEQNPGTWDLSRVWECHSVLQQLRMACLKHCKIEAKKCMATNAKTHQKMGVPCLETRLPDGLRSRCRLACLTRLQGPGRHPAPEIVEASRKTLLKTPSVQTKQGLSEVTDCGPKGSPW